MSTRVLPAVLGWANQARDRESLRLYALDAGPGPRWREKPIGRVAEQALRERGGHEGDRLLLVELDRGRWITEDRLTELAHLVATTVETALGEPIPHLRDRVDVNRTALRLLLETTGVNPASTDYGLQAQVAAVADRQLPGWRGYVPETPEETS